MAYHIRKSGKTGIYSYEVYETNSEGQFIGIIGHAGKDASRKWRACAEQAFSILLSRVFKTRIDAMNAIIKYHEAKL